MEKDKAESEGERKSIEINWKYKLKFTSKENLET